METKERTVQAVKVGESTHMAIYQEIKTDRWGVLGRFYINKTFVGDAAMVEVTIKTKNLGG